MFPHKNFHSGLSIIELLVGVGIFTIAFYGLFGILQSSMAVVAKNKARLGAMALAEEQIEYVRSLPFASVGTVNGNPSGTLPQTEVVSLNGISYSRRNAIFWVDDPADGTALLGNDTISTDYKRIKVQVSWNFHGTISSFSTSSNITPKGRETNVPGGIFNFTVFDYYGQGLLGVKINIFKNGVINADRYTGADGKWFEYGITPGTGYQITVSKSGYSTSSTYSVSANLPNPVPGYMSSIDDQVNPLSFQIDKLSTKEITLHERPVSSSFDDLFNDSSGLSDISSLTVSNSELTLLYNGENYTAQGTAFSTDIIPVNLYQWTKFSWNDTKPEGTSLLYRVYSKTGGIASLIPDAELPGNSTGFSVSPIDLSVLNNAEYGTASYNNLSVGVSATTEDMSVTPSVQDWKITYKRHLPKGNFTFHMQGAKTIGMDSIGSFVYKYDKDITTDISGFVKISPLEWDTYDITANDFDVSESCPPQPNLVTPNSSAKVFIDLYPHTDNSLFVRVVNNAGVEQTNALVRLYRSSPSYDDYQFVGKRCAQIFWPSLSSGRASDSTGYSLDVSVSPYTSTTTVTGVDVSGAAKVTVTLE